MQESYKNHTINVFQDEHPESPREFENLGDMVCFHSRYNLGDKHNYQSLDHLFEEVNKETHIIKPLYLYDHSVLAMQTEKFSENSGWHHAAWDSGLVGFYIADKETIRKNFNWTYLTKDRIAQIESIIDTEVEVYSNYLQGEVYCFEVLDKNGEFLDGCSGFYGYDEALQEAKNQISWEVNREQNAN
jgi:hypothetical protein